VKTKLSVSKLFSIVLVFSSVNSISCFGCTISYDGNYDGSTLRKNSRFFRAINNNICSD